MAIGHLLEDYGAFVAGTPVSITDVSLEEQRLEAFENGYQAGWDDSARAQSEGAQRVSADLSQNLHELSFTYQEAYAAILKSLKPLLQEMVSTVLPRAAQVTLGERLSETLLEMASDNGKHPVEIMAAHENVAVIEQMITTELPMPVTVTNDPALSDGQVYIRIGDNEREIDLASVLIEIDRVVDGFFEENQKDIA